MAEFKLERFKYNWKGEWTTSTAYKRDDVVRVGGKSYVCIITHAASATFAADLDAILPGSVPPQAQPRWVVMTNGFSFIGDWTTSIDYNLGDIVKYNGSLWRCVVNHTSSSFVWSPLLWAAPEVPGGARGCLGVPGGAWGAWGCLGVPGVCLVCA